MSGGFTCPHCEEKFAIRGSNCPYCGGRLPRSSGCFLKLFKLTVYFTFFLFLLFLIKNPCFENLRRKQYDSSAQSAGRSAKIAEERYYYDSPGEHFYTSDLADLLPYDPELNIDKGVTFVWSYAGDTNYTFTATHRKGRETFVFHD